MSAARFARGLARNALKATAYGAGTAVIGTSLTLVRVLMFVLGLH